MNKQGLAKVFGWVFLLIGILGFIPGITSGGRLLGIFEVDALHNIIHLATGIIALLMAKGSAQTFFKIFGVVYLLVTILGFVQGDTVLGLIGVNGADNVLHLVIALIALWAGFSGGKMSAMSSPSSSDMGGGVGGSTGGGMGNSSM